jgi:hypothetical protein
MAVSDLEILRAAHLHLERHGDEAVAKAREMVGTLKERGDNDGVDTWLRIIVAIETMRQEASGPHPAPDASGTVSASSNGPATSPSWNASGISTCARAAKMTTASDPIGSASFYGGRSRNRHLFEAGQTAA